MIADTPQFARLKRTRERIIDVLRMTSVQSDQLNRALQELSAAIEDEERR
jgi:hypothetical protein